MNIGIVISPCVELTHAPIRKQLPEPTFYEQLTQAARKLMINLYVFRAIDFNSRTLELVGYKYEHGRWQIQNVPLPDIVINRTFHTNKHMQQKHVLKMEQIELVHRFIYFNSSLPNKIKVYEQLAPHFKELIPPSQDYDNFLTLEKALSVYENGVILKPLSGMHGKGVIHIQQKENLYYIKGRQLNNHNFESTLSSRLALQKWLLFFRKNCPYLIQPYYKLLTADEKPFDIRVLMQKDEKGIWRLSGSTARVGQHNSLTSNLHGGGSSLPILQVLEQLFTHDKAAHLHSKTHMISGQIVEHIEACFGRFGEIALDFGIDDLGNIILLECNSKPGRQAFLNDVIFEEQVILQPLLYAKYLYRHYYTNRSVNLYRSTSIILQEVHNEFHSM